MVRENGSTFVKHVGCESCGSKDNASRYSDGHVWCYSCRAVQSAVDGDESENGNGNGGSQPKPLLMGVSCGEIPARQLSRETCEKWGYGQVVDERGSVCFVADYRTATGELVGQKLRYPRKRFLTRGRMGGDVPLYGMHLWGAGKKLVVTEGELDALSVSQAQGNQWPVVSIPHGAQSASGHFRRHLEYLCLFDVVIIMFDQDDPGRQAARECAEILPPGKAAIASLPLNDANDMLVAGRGDELRSLIWQATPFQPDGILSGDEILVKLMEPTPEVVLAFPFPELQAHTLGVRRTETVTLLAGSGTGKSTLAKEFAAEAVMQGTRVGMISLEESPRRTALGFVTIALNRPAHLLDLSGVELRKGWEPWDGMVYLYDHFGAMKMENLLSRIRYMGKGLGCGLVVLDHISIVVASMADGENERLVLDKLMAELESVAQECGLAILSICHLRKPSEGASHEQGREVSTTDARGSHSIIQCSHTVLSLERDQQAEGEQRDISRLRVLKCRHTGSTGTADLARYDRDTGRLTVTLTKGKADGGQVPTPDPGGGASCEAGDEVAGGVRGFSEAWADIQGC